MFKIYSKIGNKLCKESVREFSDNRLASVHFNSIRELVKDNGARLIVDNDREFSFITSPFNPELVKWVIEEIK
jgi:hypothetical protein